MQHLKKFTYIFLIIFSSVFAVNLPKLAPAGYNGLTPHEEKIMGQQFYAYMQARAPLIYDPLVLDYINNLGFKLVAASNRPKQHFLFFVVRDSAINAFAGPDGYVGVNTGLILFAATEGELSAVLAHEIAHTTQRHIAQGIEAANRNQLPATAAAIAGLLIGAPVIAMGAMGANAQAHINFTRSQEQDADHQGTATLQRAGFDPDDMARMFEHMEKASYNGVGKPIEFLSAHPLNENRIAHAQHQASSMKTKRYVSSLHFYLVQIRLTVDLSADPKKILNFFEKNAQSNPKNTPYQYGLALALARNLQYPAALQIMQKLTTQNPDEIYFALSLADIQRSSGHINDALKSLTEQLAVYPNYFPLILQYSTTLISANQSDLAAKFLKKYMRDYDDNLLFLDTYQEALGKSGNMIMCYQVRAKIYLLFAQTKMAIGQLELALQQPNLDAYEKDSIEAQLKNLNSKK